MNRTEWMEWLFKDKKDETLGFQGQQSTYSGFNVSVLSIVAICRF